MSGKPVQSVTPEQIAAAQVAMRSLRDVEPSMWLSDEEMKKVLEAAYWAQFNFQAAGKEV